MKTAFIISMIISMHSLSFASNESRTTRWQMTGEVLTKQFDSTIKKDLSVEQVKATIVQSCEYHILDASEVHPAIKSYAPTGAHLLKYESNDTNASVSFVCIGLLKD